MLGNVGIMLLVAVIVIGISTSACLVAFVIHRIALSLIGKLVSVSDEAAEERKYLQEFIFSRLQFDQFANHQIASEQVKQTAAAPAPTNGTANVPVTLSDFDV